MHVQAGLLGIASRGKGLKVRGERISWRLTMIVCCLSGVLCLLGGCKQEMSESGRVAQQFWNKTLTQCTDSYYSQSELVNLGRLTQFKEVSFSLNERPLSEADGLNGWEWDGESIMTCSAMRDWPYAGTWSAWSSGCFDSSSLGTATGGIRVRLFKTKGQWYYSQGTGDPGGILSSLAALAHKPIPSDKYRPAVVSCTGLPH